MAMAQLPGDSQDHIEKLSSFHMDVRRVAKLMCEEMGLDPDKLVQIEHGKTYTPYEHSIGLPKAIKAEMIISVQQWEVYRSFAAQLVAGMRAFHRYVLTEG